MGERIGSIPEKVLHHSGLSSGAMIAYLELSMRKAGRGHTAVACYEELGAGVELPGVLMRAHVFDLVRRKLMVVKPENFRTKRVRTDSEMDELGREILIQPDAEDMGEWVEVEGKRKREFVFLGTRKKRDKES